ncbi:MAG TPA: putative quinol monooxygenase [Candidatus Dormibacteraeota bacterium]|nr:putative quinol monooxygenase [Candidatus Dormibacteraeota bacterium]
MINEPTLAELDASIASVGFPVRAEALEQTWALTAETPPSKAFHERIRRAIGQSVPTGELMLLVTLRARPGRETELAEASDAFVRATRDLPGIRGSTLYRSAADPLAFTLAERFSGRQALDRHMASDYFQRFQAIQAPLLDAPVDVVFYERRLG